LRVLSSSASYEIDKICATSMGMPRCRHRLVKRRQTRAADGRFGEPLTGLRHEFDSGPITAYMESSLRAEARVLLDQLSTRSTRHGTVPA
jgi:hypothetical protein